MLCDSEGTAHTEGIQEFGSAMRQAQAIANHVGRTVYIYGPDDTDDTATPVEPELQVLRAELVAAAMVWGEVMHTNDSHTLEGDRLRRAYEDALWRYEDALEDADEATVLALKHGT
jgi:hypothetical protein